MATSDPTHAPPGQADAPTGPAGTPPPPPGALSGPTSASSPRVLHADLTNNAGGVMTDEVGVVTGDLVLRTGMTADGAVELHVQYRGASEWYAVTAGRTHLHDPADLPALHQLATGLLNRADG